MSDFCHDVVVVGSRCAGAATAMLLARQGHDVALVDRSCFPSDTLSTHAISRAGIVQLNRWGLLDDVLASGAPAIRSVSFHTPGEDTIVRSIKTSADVDHLLAPRRYALDGILRAAAIRAGVATYRGTAADIVRDSAGRVCGIQLRTRNGTHVLHATTVVGADGRGSRLADRFGSAIRHSSTSPAGTFYAYVGDRDAAGFEFHLSRSALVGVFPTHDEESCVWLSAPVPELRRLLSAGAAKPEVFRGLISEAAPSLARRLAGCPMSNVRGAAGLLNQIRRPAGPGWALVGDAGYHRDPITGHGITDAFRDAELLADALHSSLTGDLDEETAAGHYDGSRTLAIREIFTITRELTTFPGIARFAQLQRRLSQAIERDALALTGRRRPAREPVLAA